MSKNTLWGRLALLAAAMIWGSSFFILKDALGDMPVFLILAVRFSVGFALLAALFRRRLLRMKKEAVLHGVVCGVLLFTAYAFQTFGLRETTPGKNAFLTTVYCVLVPFIGWMLFRTKPSRWNWLSALVCVIGIGLVSLNESLTMNRGDALTLICGVFYALHVLAVGRYTRTEDAIALTIVQFGASAVCNWTLSLLTETMPSSVPSGALLDLCYLAVFPTSIAMLLQSVGQSVTPAAPAAILLSLESVFGVLFSVLFAGELVTPRLLCGFALIFLAVIASETHFSFLFRHRKDGLP
ncbi:MAG: DMT family transporter [Christensenellaceae bacterium]|nr:DMT family transporter [Christensenellaceae bacterium]